MKKYWQLLVMAGLIVLIMGFHYIQLASASKQTSSFTFETISGDDQYIESLLIEAGVENGLQYNTVLISENETKVVSNPYNRYTPLLFTELIKEHKNFMRGKAFHANNYYADETKLVYVEEPYNDWKSSAEDEYSYKIHMLNKAENKKSSFEVQSDLKNKFHWMSIMNTTVVNNEMKILLKQVENTGDEELYIVTIDLKEQQLLSELLIDTAKGNKSYQKSTELYNKYFNIEHEKYNVYSVTTYKASEEEANLTSRQLNVINMETNEMTPISLPEGLELELQNGIVDGNYFVASYFTNNETIIHRYNIGQQRWLDPIVAPHPVEFVNKEVNNLDVRNGKLYMMSETATHFVLQIFDIEKGTLLYEGKLLNKNAKQKYYIWVSNFYERTA